jgi:RNA polymerase sigma-70 factor (ECF subfamily)
MGNMSDWLSLQTYNKIGAYHFGEILRRMSDEIAELERLKKLDPQTITAIHNRYFPEVYRFARFRISDEHLAEDIASDVFMRLLESIHNGKGPDTNLKGWLIRTTSNIINDHYRKVYNQPIDEPEEMLEQNPDLFITQSDPVEMNDEAERLRHLRKAIDRLTDSQKLVISLRFGNRYSIEETAVIMGKERNTIKALQYRALATLRKIFDKEIL